MHKVSRSQIYEYKRAFQEFGLEGLVDQPPIPASHPNQIPERSPVSQCTGFTSRNAERMPGIVNDIITAELPGIIGSQDAVADNLDPYCTRPYGCRFAGQFTVNAIVVPVTFPEPEGNVYRNRSASSWPAACTSTCSGSCSRCRQSLPIL
jgi:hypothetical protein